MTTTVSRLQMLNEFIEKVVVHEGEGRGNDRRQRTFI